MKHLKSLLMVALVTSGSHAMFHNGGGAGNPGPGAAGIEKGVGLGQIRSVHHILSSLQGAAATLKNSHALPAHRDAAYINIIRDIRNLFNVAGERFRHDVDHKAQAISLILEALQSVQQVIRQKDQPYVLLHNIYGAETYPLRLKELSELWIVLFKLGHEGGMPPAEAHSLQESAEILQGIAGSVGFKMRIIDGIAHYEGSIWAAAGQGAAAAAGPRPDVTALDQPSDLGAVRDVDKILTELTEGTEALADTSKRPDSRDQGYADIMVAARNLFSQDGTRFRYEINQDAALKAKATGELEEAFDHILYLLKQSGRGAAQYPLLTRLTQSPRFADRVHEVTDLKDVLWNVTRAHPGNEAISKLYRQVAEIQTIVAPK